jgi:hypothetical protein
MHPSVLTIDVSKIFVFRLFVFFCFEDPRTGGEEPRILGLWEGPGSSTVSLAVKRPWPVLSFLVVISSSGPFE